MFRVQAFNWHQMMSPRNFHSMSGRLLPWVMGFCIAFFVYGLWGGLYLAPEDYQQKEAFRIIYVHVPAAFLSLAIYSILFFNSVIFLIWRIKVADILADVSAPLGAMFTLIALVTGALWGKPMWGTYWVWDARLTSELILLFLYLGYMALRSALRGKDKAGRLSAILAIMGMVDIPIVHFSVQWWQTLHQGPSLSQFKSSDIDTEMLYPLIAMIIAFGLYYLTLLLMKARTEILLRERNALWVNVLIKALTKPRQECF